MFHSFDASVIAQQLTGIAYEIFGRIEVTELLGLAWSKPRLLWRAPNVVALARRTCDSCHATVPVLMTFSDQIAFWVATMILSEQNLKERVEVLTKFLHIIRHLFNNHDFNTLMAVLVGLGNSAVSRLRRTWAAIDPELFAVRFAFQTLLLNSAGL